MLVRRATRLLAVLGISRMEYDNHTARQNITEEYAFEELFHDHRGTLFIVSLASIFLGLPLAGNTLWHLRGRTCVKKVMFLNHNQATFLLRSQAMQEGGVSYGYFQSKIKSTFSASLPFSYNFLHQRIHRYICHQ